MKTLIFIILVSFGFVSQIFSQYKPGDILLSINKNNISVGEFERAYLKNKIDHTVNNESVDEYFDLFVKFRLKLLAAHDLGLDTLTSYKQEFKTYRDQLAKSYMVDSITYKKIVKEAYDHTLNEISVSHILIRLPRNPSVDDTVRAYHKIDSLRNCILGGESFESIAMKYSDDKSVKTNYGYLGYFSAFHVDYNFEVAAYNTPAGNISRPVRTKYGYHIIKVKDFRKSPGEVKLAHILAGVTQNAPESHWKDAKLKIDVAYERLNRGEDFGKVALELSEDRNSSKNNGELPWISAGQTIQEFEDQAFALKTPGSYSAPFKTYFGWQIVKLIAKREIPPFAQMEGDLKMKVQKDPERQAIIKRAFVNSLKKSYAFQEYKENLKCFYELDSTILKGKFNIKSSELNKTLFKIQSKNYTVENFKTYLKSNPPVSKVFEDLKDYIDKYYNLFVDYSFNQYEDNNLESKYPDFHNLVQEYHDGILLYDVMDRQVWSKASTDTAGLKNFFSTVTNKYYWGDRAKATIFYCKSQNEAQKLEIILNKSGSEPPDYDQLGKEVCDSISDTGCLKIEHKYYSKGDNSLIDSLAWKPQISDPIVKNNQYIIIKVEEIVKPQPKKFQEVRGLVIVDYQNAIEENWLNDLKKKYPVEVNHKLLHKIAEKYNNHNK